MVFALEITKLFLFLYLIPRGGFCSARCARIVDT